MAENSARARVILIGGDAHRLRSLRIFLDSLGMFDSAAIATGGAGLGALIRQPWDAAIVVDDLTDVPTEKLVPEMRKAGYKGPVLALAVQSDRARVAALYGSGVGEVLALGPSPTAEIARALGRAMDRYALESRIEMLEHELGNRPLLDEDTGVYPPWRFDDEWRLEQARTKRRGGELTILSLLVETTPELAAMPAPDRTTVMRQMGRAIRSTVRDGDVAVHDGGAKFRFLLADTDSSGAADLGSKLSSAIKGVVSSAKVTVRLEESFR